MSQSLAKPVKFDEIDKAKEEKKRGITINIAHIGYESLKRRYSHTDCPGHSDFIKNMICGTAQMDAAVLVIAATDGVMAQTKEHLILARQIGLKHIIVFINKADLVEDDVLDLVEIESRELLSAHGFDGDNAPIIRGSALLALEGKDASSITELLKVLDDLPEPQRQQDDIHVIGNKKIITYLYFVLEASTERTTRMWLGHIGSVNVTNFIKAEMYLLSEEENGRKVGIRSGFTDKLFCSTWDQVARFELAQELLMPGEHTQATVTLMRSMPFRKGMPFTLRDGNTKQTIARGLISELLPPVTVEKYNLKKAAAHHED
ncbi:putative translation elongation factor Tu [Necator americanus]|uniref:protein-synthesizing GTPase n=1 Tax=Necator americanus TaxID=51031 RepID=W2TQJ5_NECAM|nr:putative translation elongation factor Tu [Necator americanus]ETN83949.1 putative translation elongation factor Tu [Necator americanus]